MSNVPGEFHELDVVVTGGTGALGTAVVAQLVERGARVHVPVFHEAELERFPLREHEQVSFRVGVDLADEKQVVSFYADRPEVWASIHIAGGYAGAPIVETGADVFVKMMSMNGMSAFLCCREAVRRMREKGAGGRIVNVSAKPALVPAGGSVAYAASKAAVASITQCLAEEVKSDGIWVNAIVPSIIDTPANRKAMPTANHDGWPKTDELAATIVFLASPSNRATRGALVPVYGGS
jgi:NAD(P)-dependent dehydrogenase (short-subunit alcohol dehydrogenase family)